MLLRVPQALSFPTTTDGVKMATHAPARVMCASVKSSNNAAISGVVFEPFEEVKKELNLVPSAPVRRDVTAWPSLKPLGAMASHGVFKA
nr:ferritin-4, chloroplastic-like [Tanacetum cinerariifolium]